MNPPDPHPPAAAGRSPEADPFEAWLAREFGASQPGLPAMWRDQILTAARGASSGSEVQTASPASRPWLGWIRWLHSGWTVATAAWVLTWGLYAYAVAPAPGEAGVDRPPFSERVLAEQRAFQKGLVGS